MTTIVFQKQAGRLSGFYARGHANFAEYGNDIVCAAVSALTQATMLGLDDVLGIDCIIRRQDSRGLLSCILPSRVTLVQRNNADIILQTLYKGLLSIQLTYPKNIRVTCKDRRWSKCSQ